MKFRLLRALDFHRGSLFLRWRQSRIPAGSQGNSKRNIKSHFVDIDKKKRDFKRKTKKIIV